MSSCVYTDPISEQEKVFVESECVGRADDWLSKADAGVLRPTSKDLVSISGLVSLKDPMPIWPGISIACATGEQCYKRYVPSILPLQAISSKIATSPASTSSPSQPQHRDASNPISDPTFPHTTSLISASTLASATSRTPSTTISSTSAAPPAGLARYFQERVPPR